MLCYLEFFIKFINFNFLVMMYYYGHITLCYLLIYKIFSRFCHKLWYGPIRDEAYVISEPSSTSPT